MSATSLIRFENYVITKIVFSLNQDFNGRVAKGILIDPVFNREHRKLDSNRLQVSLGVEINCDLFHLTVEMSGVFECANWESDPMAKELLLTNTSAILFPFLRSTVSTITMNANIPSYTLPVVNIMELFKNQN
jgi:preprotein translocase subunit SecB